MALGPLIFGRSPATDGSIVFGEGSDSRGLIRIAVTLPGPVVEVIAQSLAPVVDVSADIALPGPTVSATARAINWNDAMVSRAGAPWRDAATLDATHGNGWADAAPAVAATASPWRDTSPAGFSTGAAWHDLGRLHTPSSSPWRDATTARYRFGYPWREAEEVSQFKHATWQQATELLTERAHPWQPCAHLAPVFAEGVYTASAPLPHVVSEAWHQAQGGHVVVVEPWRDGTPLESHGGPRIVPPVPPGPVPCYSPDPALVFRFRPAVDGSIVFRCGNAGEVPTGPAATIVVPTRKVYAVLDSFILRRVSDSAPLHALGSASMSLDSNSWTWALSFSLPLSQASLVEAASDGTPVEVEAVVNGVAYRALAESVSRERAFPSGSVKVSCRGIGGALDVLSGTYSNTGAVRTAAQIMGDILSVNGVGTGWSVDFGLTDWTVAADQWAHTGTAISALQAVAQAAGGYLQPHPTLKTIRVLPKYPVLPWDWATALPDLELPSAAVLRESIQWVEKPRFNRVYVSGQGQGVLCRVTRAGSAGDLHAAQVVDPLISSAVVGRQRGESILGDTGRQALVTLSLPILAETGIIPPGKLIRYVDGVDIKVGLTRSVQVLVNRAGSRQTIGVETHA